MFSSVTRLFGGREVFGGEPPGDGVVLHGFEDEAGRERRGVAFHHLVVEAADGLDLAEGEGVAGVGVLEIEVVGAPGLGVGVGVALGGEGEQGVGLVVHEVAADLVGGVGEARGVPVRGGGEKDDGGVDGPGGEAEEVGFVAGGPGVRAGSVSLRAGVFDLDGGDGGASGVGEEAQDASVRHQGDVGQGQDLPDAVDVGVGFGVDETRVAVAGVAADAF